MTSRRTTWSLALALVLGVVLVYAPVGGHDWVRYDDDEYLLENPHVNQGLAWNEIQWAFTHQHAANYHPLTWISHMLDVELFGLEPGPHHWVSVGLHALNAVLAMHLLLALLQNIWAAGLGAALFALHPLRVESVAWAAERKDVLCASFFLAALLAYLRYGRAPSRARYLVVAGTFCLALLSKPMAVTFPVLALLLDFWPLRRLARGPSPAIGEQPMRRILIEKLPLFALAGLAALATLSAQSQAGSTSSFSSLALELRLLNALRSVGVYLAQSCVPGGLSVFYPHAASTSAEPARALLPGALAGAALVGAGLVLAWRVRRSVPVVTVGIGLHLVTLLPVLGLLQVGTQAHADRYTYLPALGLVAAALGAGLCLRARLAPCALGLAAVLALGVLARRQVGYWQDTRTLFEHALALDEHNYLAHTKLGELALEAGDEPRARAAFQRALALHPRDAHVLDKLALCHLAQGEFERARECLLRALALEPDDQESLLNLGTVELELGDFGAAQAYFEACLARHPPATDALFNLGVLAQRALRMEEAEQRFEAVLALDSAHADAWSNLGQVRLARGRLSEALAAFEKVVELAPDDPFARYNLGSARARRGDVLGARQAFERALELDPTFELAGAALQGLEEGG